MLAIDDTLKQKIRDLLSKSTHENKVPWLYRDSNGHLTIGVGHLVIKEEDVTSRDSLTDPLSDLLSYNHEFLRQVPSFATDYGTFCGSRTPSQHGPVEAQSPIVSFAARLKSGSQIDDSVPGPWGLELDSYKKKKAEDPYFELLVDEAWNIVTHRWTLGSFKGRTGLPYGAKKAGEFYQCHSTFRLTDKGIADLLNRDIDTKLKELEKYVKQDQLKQWPEDAVLVVIDLVFQWGVAGIFKKKMELAAAIIDQDWEAAAKQVPQQDGGSRTNDRIELFKKAASAKKAQPRK